MMNTTASFPFPSCPTQLSDTQLEQYWEKGFIAFENALSPDEVASARQSISDMISKYAFNDELSIYKAPTGSGSNQAGASFKSRNSNWMMTLEPGMEPSPEDPEAIESMVRKFMWFEDESPLFKSICTDHPRIQGVVKSILGSQVDLYQSMALIKPAHHGSEKPWHQDNAYFSVENLDQILGTWIALDDVTVDNGAMHFLPGAHRDGPLKHEHTTDCEIVKDRYSTETAEPIHLRAGGIVFFHGNAPHFTPPNRSAHRRRALQYHYRAVENRLISKEEYTQVFQEADGTPASCAAAIPENF